MGFGKWIGGVMGFMAGGPLGALAGYALGSFFDKATDLGNVGSETASDDAYGKWIGGVMGFMAGGPLGALAGYALGSFFDKATDLGNVGSETASDDAYAGPAGQRNSFLFSMLVMASYIIRADGRIMHSEMEFVRRFLRTNFGEAAVAEGEQILLNLFEQRKQMERTDPTAFRRTIRDCGAQIAANLSYAYIIRADGRIMHSEMEFVRRFLRTNFGEAAVAEGEQILLNLFEQRKQLERTDPTAFRRTIRDGGAQFAANLSYGERVQLLSEQILLNLFEQRKQLERTDPTAFRRTIRDGGAQFAANLSYGERVQLLSFLVQIAQSDGRACAAEVDALKEVSQAMALSDQELGSLMSLRSDSLEDAYKVLGSGFSC